MVEATNLGLDSAESAFAPFLALMKARNSPALTIETFRRRYYKLRMNYQSTISQEQLQPFTAITNLEELSDYTYLGRENLNRTVMIKLNGGLGTGMGLEKAKSLLPVKPGRTFLDVVAQHVLNIRKQYNVRFPLLLMNSFRTEEDSLNALKTYQDLPSAGLPLSFIQSQIPKISIDTFAPVSWPQDPSLEWCPPGHGDIYTALITTGLLQKLLEQGYEYAYVSNIDNLGSMFDLQILGYFVKSGATFMMEVADRMVGDRKGGHLGRYQNGRWMLRELAQCPGEEQEAFQDIQRYSYFNTNNIWWHLPSLYEELSRANFILDLPIISNQKTVEPQQPDSPPVFQLETAVGSALELFENAVVLRVPRSRQIAVKHWSELITVWSDAYIETSDGRIVLNPACGGKQPVIELDKRYYSVEQDIKRNFPYGIPSLVACSTLEIKGRVIFGRDINIQGNVLLQVENLEDQAYIPHHTTLNSNSYTFGDEAN